jgi:hypothetical protein
MPWLALVIALNPTSCHSFAVGIKQRGRCKVVRGVFDSPGKVERILDARVGPEAIERWMSE